MMHSSYYIFLGVIGLTELVVGLILLFVWSALKTRQQNKFKTYLSRDLVWKVKKAMVDAMSESMDIMPEKVMESKRILERE